MTLPIERTWSLKRTREFLRSLLDRKATPRVPSAVREQAYRCLKHFPWDLHIAEAAKKAPDTFGLEIMDKSK